MIKEVLRLPKAAESEDKMEVNIRNKWNGSVLFSVTGTTLRGAKLFGLNLRDADLRKAELFACDLRGSDLRGSDLRGADLRRADLCGARINANQKAMLLKALGLIIIAESEVSPK